MYTVDYSLDEKNWKPLFSEIDTVDFADELISLASSTNYPNSNEYINSITGFSYYSPCKYRIVPLQAGS